MPLSEGTRLGRYEIRSQIGAGGMGEVYLAQDTKLDRKVALKILPAELAANQDRMRRFVQEAKAAAALNHPNIATIHEIGESDGVNYIVMEFIDGVTLREKLHQEQTELRKLLRFLQHAAEGLARAHAAGIVHRDLKPDNIMVTRDGHAKVLDFGLAKLIEPQQLSGSGSSEVATALMQQHSTPGTILGTVGYMSPEQAQGKTAEIDHRSDVFSFGCILYEAITGHKPFEGKDTIDTLNRIIREPAAAFSSINPEVPPDLQRIVRRCLAKDPEERYQTIKDVVIEIKEVRRDLRAAAGTQIIISHTGDGVTSQSSGPLTSTHSTASISDTAAPSLSRTSSAEYVAGQIKNHRTAISIGVAIVIIVGVAAVFGLYKLFSSTPPAVSPFTSMKIEKLTDTGKAGSVAISPDGKIVVHVVEDAGQQSLWVRHIATGSNVQVIPPAEVFYGRMTFSTDGNYVYFVRSGKDDFSGSLYSMPVFGGDAKKLVADVASSITFSPDSKRFAFVRTHPIKNESYLILSDADGANQQTLATLKGDEHLGESGASWSPDGKVIAVGIVKDTPAVIEYLATISVGDGTIKSIGSQHWVDVGRVGWLTDGSGLVVANYEKGAKNAQYYVVSYPEGVARRITNDVNDYHDLSLTADSRTLATVQEDRIINLWIAPNADAKSLRQITFGSGKYEGASGVRWTPDGRIIHGAWAGGNSGDIWISNADGSGAKRLTNTPSSCASWEPVMSPDGRYVVFVSDRAGKSHLWRIDSDGGNLKQLTSGDKYERDPSISPDGRWLFYASYDGEHLELWRMPIDGGESTRLTEGFLADLPTVSPDGKTIAAYYRESGGSLLKLILLSIDGGKPIKIFDTTQNPTNFRWAPDGHSLFYGDTKKGVTNIWALPIDGGPPRQITDFNSQQIYAFDLDRSGKPTLFSRGETRKDVVLITGFR